MTSKVLVTMPANQQVSNNHSGAMGHMHTQLTKSLERILEEAHLSGELKLSGRKLKDFPRTGGKYDLSDTVIADLSKNKFWELPQEVLEFLFVEKLHLYHNALRSLPEGVGCLQALRFLDLSRNQLCSLPEGLCHLQSLEVLLIANNKLGLLPDDVGNLKNLMELDASCNEITHLPRSLARLKNLKALNLRRNLLTELPLELTYLKLTSLDMSDNRLSTLPVELRLMPCLERLRLDGNPLLVPPAMLVARGRVHIFKFLETQAANQDKRRGGGVGGGGEDSRRTLRKNTLPDLRSKRYTVDSGYSTGDGGDAKWANEFSLTNGDAKSRVSHIPKTGEGDADTADGSLSRSSLALDQMEAKRLIQLQTNDRAPERPTRPMLITNGNGHRSPIERINGLAEEKKPLEHIQTYREYKEALRQQRAAQPQDVYRPRDGTSSQQHSPADNPDKSTEKVLPRKIVTNGESKPLVNGEYLRPTSPGTPRQASPRPTKWATETSDKLSFTMRREFERAKEEAELMAQLRHNIESRLRMSLPEDLGPALMDGVVLCHLANHVRPRSVASIHVPSPAVPKLSMARCRRNVDNFLEACRRIGVEDAELCSVDDVVTSLNPAAILRTVHGLLHPYMPRSPPAAPPPGPSSISLLMILLATCLLLYFLPHEE